MEERGSYLPPGFGTRRKLKFGSPVSSSLLVSLSFWHLRTAGQKVSFLSTVEAELFLHPPLALRWGGACPSQWVIECSLHFLCEFIKVCEDF